MRTARARRRSNSTSTRRRFRVGWGQRTLQCFGTPTGAWTTENVGHDVEGDTHTVTLSYATPVAVVALEPGRVEVVESVVPADQVRWATRRRSGQRSRTPVTARQPETSLSV